MAELVALGAVDEHARGLLASSQTLETRQRRLASLQGVGEAGLVAASSLAVWAAALLVAPRAIGGRASRARKWPCFSCSCWRRSRPSCPCPPSCSARVKCPRRRAVCSSSSTRGHWSPSRTASARAPIPKGPLGLRARDLRFRYGPDQPWVIDSLSFEAPAGRITGIVGPTGIGKSSLVSALLRFWEYEQGRIEILGSGGPVCELRELATDDARRLFSVLPQTPYLFHASLRENLLLALPEEHPSDEAGLREALDIAQMSRFLESLPTDWKQASVNQAAPCRWERRVA